MSMGNKCMIRPNLKLLFSRKFCKKVVISSYFSSVLSVSDPGSFLFLFRCSYLLLLSFLPLLIPSFTIKLFFLCLLFAWFLAICYYLCFRMQFPAYINIRQLCKMHSCLMYNLCKIVFCFILSDIFLFGIAATFTVTPSLFTLFAGERVLTSPL